MLNQYRDLPERWIALLSIAILCLIAPRVLIAEDNETEQERGKASGDALTEILNSSNGIPMGVLNKSECVIDSPRLT